MSIFTKTMKSKGYMIVQKARKIEKKNKIRKGAKNSTNERKTELIKDDLENY